MKGPSHPGGECRYCSQCDKYYLGVSRLTGAAEKLIDHLEFALGDIKLSGTYHLKERLKEAIEKTK